MKKETASAAPWRSSIVIVMGHDRRALIPAGKRETKPRKMATARREGRTTFYNRSGRRSSPWRLLL